MINTYLDRLCVAALVATAIITLFLSPLVTKTAGAAGGLDEQTRIELQMTLKDFIDKKSEEGTYPFFDVDKGSVRKLRLKTLHPIIFERDGNYMMCADFLGDDGKDVLIDYIVVPADGGFFVEQQILGRRSYLKTLFDRIF